MPAEKIKPAENSFFRFLQEALERAGSNVDDAYRQMYEPVLGAIEPDADQYGGPSDMDADNMAVGGLAGRMGTPPPPPGYRGAMPPPPPLPDLYGPDYSGNATLPNATLPNATLPNATLPNATRPNATRPNATLPDLYGLDYSGNATRTNATLPNATRPPSRMGGGLPPGTFRGAGLGFAGAAAPVLAAAMIERALAAKDSLDARIARGQSTMPGYQPAGAVEVRVGPRDAGRYSYMPPVNPPAPAPMARVSAGAPVSPAPTPMRMPPAMAVTPTPDTTDYRSAYAPTPMSPRMGDFSDEVRQLGMNRSADAALAPFLTDEADPMIEALMQRISARQARGGV